jgi:hypothetical protein
VVKRNNPNANLSASLACLGRMVKWKEETFTDWRDWFGRCFCSKANCRQPFCFQIPNYSKTVTMLTWLVYHVFHKYVFHNHKLLSFDTDYGVILRYSYFFFFLFFGILSTQILIIVTIKYDMRTIICTDKKKNGTIIRDIINI